MKALISFYLIIFSLISLTSRSEIKEIPFTLDDRDRIMRTEQMVQSLRNDMTTRFESMDERFESVDKQFDSIYKQFESVNQRFDQLFNFLWAIIGIFTTFTVSIIGFAFWDRKQSMAPLRKDQTRIIESLRELAVHQPKLREILKNAGLM